jgi:hypothetical protein
MDPKTVVKEFWAPTRDCWDYAAKISKLPRHAEVLSK